MGHSLPRKKDIRELMGHPLPCEKDKRELLGHPLPCSSAGCFSVLRAVRAVSVHYPKIRSFLRKLYTARKAHISLIEIDDALSEGDHLILFEVIDILTKSFSSLFEINENSDDMQNIEQYLMVKYAGIINQYMKEVADDPIHACCSCKRLFKRRESITLVSPITCKSLT